MANYTINIRDLDSLFYKVGDRLTDVEFDCFGHITSGGALLLISITMSKSIKNISSINLTSLKISMRIPTGGYVGGTLDYEVVTSGISIVPAKKENAFRFSCNKTGGWGVTNNIPVAGIVRITGTFV